MDPSDPGQTPQGATPPAWGPTPAPAASAWSSIWRRIPFVAGAIVVTLVAFGMIRLVLSPTENGRVIFTTDAPTASGAQTCQLGNQVTSVVAGTPVYANYFYKSPLTNETVTLTVIKDGSVLGTETFPSERSNGVRCVESAANLGDLEPGVYEFKLTTSKGETVSDGKLTIK